MAKKKTKKKNKPTHYMTRYAGQFTKFIRSPQLFEELFTVNSTEKPLQERQRITLVNVVRTLLSHMEAEYNQVGFCKHGKMDGITHKRLREDYENLIKEPISKDRWFRAIDQLKEAGLFKTKTAWQDHGEGDECIIRSVASKKWFTAKFFNMLGLEKKADVIRSRQHGIADRVAKGLSNLWRGYKLFNNSRVKHSGTYDVVPDEYETGIFNLT